jgi:hypothetical protein
MSPTRLRVAAALVLCAAVGACNLIPRVRDGNQATNTDAERLQLLQLQVMRFADEYAGRIVDPITQFKRDTRVPEERLAAQNWLLSQTTSAYTIASGPNPTVNALDMIVLATLSRMVTEDSWVTERFGERAVPLRDAHRELEPRAWTLAQDMLTDEQRERLRAILNEWRARNPQVRSVAYIHFHDFAKSMGHPTPDEAKAPGSLFGLLGIDPLSKLDPAVREIAQARHLAERAIFYLQRTPGILDMQVERLTYQIAAAPEAQQLLADVNRTALAVEKAGNLADDLPAIVARERAAAIDQLSGTLFAEEARMRELAVELRNTLEAGTATSQSLNETIRALDALAARFGKAAPGATVGAATSPAVATQPGRKPFDIGEYTAAARELAATARELRTLVEAIEGSAPSLATVAQDTTRGVNDLIDTVFWRIVLCIVILIVGSLGAAVAWRVISRRL